MYELNNETDRHMKVVIQNDLISRSEEVFLNAANQNNIEFLITNVMDESAMLSFHNEGANCFVIGAESYSRSFYESIKPGSAVIRYGVGYNAVPIDICIKREIAVCYTPGTLTDSVAEHTFAMLLAMNRNIPQLDRSMKSYKWQAIKGLEIKDKTIGILGFGQIGKAVARIAKCGFGMKINAFDQKPSTDCEYVDYYSNDFQSVVENADIITIHMPVMPAIKGFINRERIAMCKDGVQLINTSRGDLVDEIALFEALQIKKISAAALDVFVTEPYVPTAGADFRKLENVILTPHCGSNTTEASNRMAELVIKNILAYNQGEKMILIPELDNKSFL